jgi:hypothetical protein
MQKGQREHILDVLRSAREFPQVVADGEYGWQEDGWVALEALCDLPSGGRVMAPQRRRSELRKKGYVIEVRRRTRHPQGTRAYSAMDWRLTSEPVEEGR